MKNFKEKLRNNKQGITLIALVVTIVVLLILAGITIGTLLGNNGLLNKASSAKEEYSKSSAKEKVELLLSEYGIEKYTKENTDFAVFLRKNLQVGVVQNNDNTYSFMLGDYQVVTDENKVISIEKFKLNVDKTYPSVVDMKADTSLTSGKIVQTEGYYSKTYGGSAYYDIVDTTNLAVDNGKCIQLDNGLYAELHAINSTVTVNQFGAYGDGEHDDAVAIQKTLSSGFENISFENERYKFGSIIKIDSSNISLIGNSSTIFWDTSVPLDLYQFYIEGKPNEHLTNINIFGLNFENGNTQNSNESSQLLVVWADNIIIDSCKFNILEIANDNSRNTTNLWLHTGWNNVKISNCTFSNLSNGSHGGNIWAASYGDINYISGNLTIENNYIEHTGADESIAINFGHIENVDIKNNNIYVHEDKTEQPGIVNITLGNKDICKNVNFLNNKITAESQGNLIAIQGGVGSDNINIQNNDIEYKLISTDILYSQVFIATKGNTTNINVSENNINYYNTLDSYIGRGAIIDGENLKYLNNNIEITGPLKYLMLSTDNSDIILENNNITVNSDIEGGIIGGYTEVGKIQVKNNNIDVKGNWNNIVDISGNLNNNIIIENNKFNITSDTTWEERTHKFLHAYSLNISNYDIKLNYNSIITNQSSTQEFVKLAYLKDSTLKKIEMNGNKYGIFKKIGFYGNVVNPQIFIDNKIISSDTYLD